MPVYHCYLGHAAGVALEHEGVFALRDRRGRDWLCHVSAIPTLEGWGDEERQWLLEDLTDSMRPRLRACNALGVAFAQSYTHTDECDGLEALADRLSQVVVPWAT